MATYSRTDSRLTRGALVVVAVLTPVFLIVLPIVDWVRGEPLTWAGRTGDGASLAPLLDAAGGAQLTWDGEAQVRLADAPAGLWLAVLGAHLLLGATIVAVALLMRHVVGEIEVGRPFTASSLRALRATGLLVVVVSLALPAVLSLVDSLVMDRALADGVTGLSLDINPLWFLAGLLVLAVEEAFHAGARLTDDVEGLV